MGVRDDAIKAMANIADDWVWTGGKPGELTGGMYDSLYSVYSLGEKQANLSPIALEWLTNWKKANPQEKRLSESDLEMAVRDQLKGSPILSKRANTAWGPDDIMDDFRLLEQAGIPRKWTGKIAEALPSMREWQNSPLFTGGDRVPNNAILDKYFLEDSIQLVSDLMRPMTNDQRQTFLNLLPRWTGTIETAAAAAKKLYRR